jgi:CMP-N,N'-diacetyllegionaminic acid synthase
MSSLGIIPIRHKSVRLPGKAFKTIAGKTLIDWTLEAAKLSSLDEVIVVTSCKEIWQHCADRDVAVVVRPIGLEGDTCHVLHTINWLNESALNNVFNVQMLLQITNPTRTAEDINQCLDLLDHPNINSVCSVVDVGEFHPDRMFKGMIGLGIEPLTRGNHWSNTQQLPKIYLRDGAVYGWKTKTLMTAREDTLLPPLTVRYEIELNRSIRIDTLPDLVKAENYLTGKENSLPLILDGLAGH